MLVLPQVLENFVADYSKQQRLFYYLLKEWLQCRQIYRKKGAKPILEALLNWTNCVNLQSTAKLFDNSCLKTLT